MKKILVVSDSLRIGGIQTSLKTFLKILSSKGYKIDLFLFNDDNSKNVFNQNIKIISGSKLLKIISYTKEEAKKKGFCIYLIRCLFAILCRLFGSNIIYKLLFVIEKKLKYDIAISYSNNVSFNSTYFGYNKFVLEKVSAPLKIAYIHVDYNNIQCKKADEEYKKFDKIWFVSKYTLNTFLKYNKGQKNKCNVIYNFIDEEKIRYSINNPYNNSKFHIVTIGRLDENKSQIDAVEISSKLKEKKIDFEWYLIGDGPDKDKINNLIKNNNLEQNVFLLGNKNNIADYLYNSNIFVSLSKSESYGLAIVEALYTNTIVIVRKIPVIHEIIDNNGIVCDNISEITSEIIKLYSDKKYYNTCKKNAKIIINNEIILEQIKKEFGD